MKHLVVGMAALAMLLGGASRARADFNITNGSFETGDFTGWTRAGFFLPAGGPPSGNPSFQTFMAAQAADPPKADTNAVENFQTKAFDGFGFHNTAIGPTQGSFLAFISNETSAGNFTLTGSSISQTFTVPTGALSLNFDIRLLNNDDPASFASYNDFGGIAISQGSTVLQQFNIDLNPASTANAHVVANANQGGFHNDSGWQSSSFDISGLVGQTITVTLYSINAHDNGIESRLLADNIHLLPPGVPEPSSFVLLGLSAAGMLGHAWRRRNRRAVATA